MTATESRMLAEDGHRRKRLTTCGAVVRNKNNQHVYVVEGVSEEATNGRASHEQVVYRDGVTGKLYRRDVAEFCDGRFTIVE
jgi:hypothetical protein